MMTTTRFLRSWLSLVASALLLAVGVSAHADEVPGPRPLPPEDAKPDEKPAVPPEPVPLLTTEDFKLLPITEAERLQLGVEHAALFARLRTLTSKHEKEARQLARLQAQRKPNAKKLAKAKQTLVRTRVALQTTWQEALPHVEPMGVTREVLARVEAAPTGVGRAARYAHALVLDLPLDEAQRAFFERVVPEVNGAWFTLAAQKRRLELVAKQAELQPEQRRALVSATDQQLRLIDQRFWLLTDFVLRRGQRRQLMDLVPTEYTKVQNAVEHLYQLPEMKPAQGTRLQALLTEMEAELAPDQATVRRVGARMKTKDLTKEERKALQEERTEAYKRMQALQLYAAKETKALLTSEQYDAYRAIPPRLSHNDRRMNPKRVFERVTFTPAQDAAMKALDRSYRAKRRAMQKRIAELRRESADYGPDSPQMGMMQMEMAAAGAEGARLQREAIGRILLEVLTHDQVSSWALGLTGRAR